MATYMEPPVKKAFPVVETAKNIVFSFPWLNEALSIPLCLANVQYNYTCLIPPPPP